MRDAFGPVLKQSLSDKLAQRIRGDDPEGRLPDGRSPAADHGDGASGSASGIPTIREALKKLETMGFVEIRHGSGVYVTRSEEVLVLASPDLPRHRHQEASPRPHSTSREPLETQSVAEAVRNATLDDLVEMRRLLNACRRQPQRTTSC